jgi:hypothetical protein
VGSEGNVLVRTLVLRENRSTHAAKCLPRIRDLLPAVAMNRRALPGGDGVEVVEADALEPTASVRCGQAEAVASSAFLPNNARRSV